MIYVFILAGALVLLPFLLWLGRKYMHLLVERKIADYQNELIIRHSGEVENIYKQMRGWAHDYHNHIQTMKAYLAQNQTDELMAYYDQLDEDLSKVDTVIKTGNVMIDAVLNSKVSLAQSKDIEVDAEAIVPKTLTIQPVDLCVIVGNLMDNAIEACLSQANKTERFIRVYIGIHKQLLYISVSNSVGSTIKKEGKIYRSTKGSPSHGFGLVRIDKISKKYQGFVNRQNEEGIFATEVMIPL